MSFNPLALESGWKVTNIKGLADELASFNPLALESGWKVIGTFCAGLITLGFNPLALESGWKEQKTKLIRQCYPKFQSACAGEWLESTCKTKS